MNKKQKKVLSRILIAAFLLVVLMVMPTEGWLRLALFMIPYLTIGYDILIKAGKGIWRLQPFDENFLMAVATVGAILLGEYAEGVFVMLFYQIGELFQSYAVGKSRRNISKLMDIRPEYANRITESGETEEVDPEEVVPGSEILVKPGEKIPIDGIILEGSSALNTVALTGESVPRDACAGDEVISGCINLTGVLKIRTTKAYEDSTVAKILDLVENASSKKSRSERFIAQFARVYTPVVCCSALALALLPPLVCLLFLQLSPSWGEWIYRALTFLVISCPCALVISIPLSFFAGIGGASHAGVLIKGSNYLETLSKVRTVVMDKTGTLTEGVFEVSGMCAVSCTEDALLEYAALAEAYSHHPIGESLRQAYAKDLSLSRVRDVCEISGHGITARVDRVAVAVGNDKLMERLGIRALQPDAQGTAVHVSLDGVYAGYILITDRIKKNAKEAITSLRKLGVRRTVMLTGDAKPVGEAVARSLEIDRVHCELLPADKVTLVEELLADRQRGEALAFVGDGINDAPVLSRADVGIAMGALGSDAAIEAADVVLMDDDPAKVAQAIRIARKCLGIVYQNIYFALGVKFLCLLLGALGYANMWLAVFADVGVMVIAVLNAIRALRVKKEGKEMEHGREK